MVDLHRSEGPRLVARGPYIFSAPPVTRREWARHLWHDRSLFLWYPAKRTVRRWLGRDPWRRLGEALR
jgi:hypothetical protein